MGALYITGREWNWDHFESRTRSGVLGKKKIWAEILKRSPTAIPGLSSKVLF